MTNFFQFTIRQNFIFYLLALIDAKVSIIKVITPLSLQTILLFLFALFLQYGCATSRPNWINTPPESTKEMLYFTGIGSSSKSLKDAKQEARENALSNISSYISSQIESVSKSYTTETQRSLSSQKQSQSKAIIKNAKFIDSYNEKIPVDRVTKNNIKIGKTNEYTFWELVSYPKKKAREAEEEAKKKAQKIQAAQQKAEAARQKEIRQQKERDKKTVTKAYRLYLAGLRHEEQKAFYAIYKNYNKNYKKASKGFYAAYKNYKEAKTLITSIKSVIKISGNKQVKDSTDLNSFLDKHLQKMLSQLKISWSTVWQGRYYDRSSCYYSRDRRVLEQNFETHFEAMISDRYTITENGDRAFQVDVAIISISCTFDRNNYESTAYSMSVTGKVKITRISDNKYRTSLFKAKPVFYYKKRDAYSNAYKEAANQAAKKSIYLLQELLK